MRLLIDTNVLIRMRDTDSAHHADCVAALAHLRESHPGSACLCAQVMIEYWVVATRPAEVNGLGLTIAETEQDIFDLQQVFPCLPEPPDIANCWLKVVVSHAVQGRQAHDARLIAFMRTQDISYVLTINKDHFTRYEGISVLSPADALRL